MWSPKLQGFVYRPSSSKCLLSLISNNLKTPSHCTSLIRIRMFSSFTDILSDENKSRVKSKLKSMELAQNPKYRRSGYPVKDHPIIAATLVPFCLVDGEPSLLLMLRTSRLNNSYSRQVSFPGGHKDESDPDLTFTALRETQEEMGIPPSSFEVWGQLNSLPTGNGRTMVTPILASTGEMDVSKLRLSQDEVEEVFTVPIANLCHPDNVRSTRFRYKGMAYTTPVFTGSTHRIWGLTAITIHLALSMVAGDLYKFKLRHKPSYEAH